MKTRRSIPLTITFLVLTGIILTSTPAAAHCDGMDGPVVKAAQKALATGDVNLVLIWVQKEDEQEIRDAFGRTLAVRNLGEDARELADLYFFETLVRIHRAGEGAPYTGLKPAGRDLGPAIPLADSVLITRDIAPLVNLITDEARRGLLERFERAMVAGNFSTDDLEAGREYVRTYVTFIHYVERTYEAATQPIAGHYPEHERTRDASHD